MEAEKIFCKNLDQFCKDNCINKNKFYKNIENVISYYEIKKEYIKRDPREVDANKSGSIRNKDYRVRKLSEPLLALMVECIIKNKLKNKNSNFEKFPLRSFLEYTEFTLNKIENLPADISTQIMDSQSYQYNYVTTKYINIFLDKIEEILNIMLSFNIILKDSTICDVIAHLNTIIDLLNADYNDKNILEETKTNETKKIKAHENFQNPLLLDDIVKLEFNRLNNLQDDIHSKLKTDITNNPKIYKVKKADHIVNNPGYYYLNKDSKREDLFLILKNKSFLSDTFISSLKSQKSTEYIESLHSTSPKQYSLVDFIDIYKQDAYNQLKSLENKYNNLPFSVRGNLKQIRIQNINNIYFDILNKLSGKIGLAKKYISNQILYASKMTSVEFLRFKEIMSYLYEIISNKKNFNGNIYFYRSLCNNISTPEDYNLAEAISNTKYIEEIRNKNNEDNYTYKIDTFLQLYTDDNILNLVLKNMNLNEPNKLKCDKIINLSSGIKINLSSLIKDKNISPINT